MRNDMEAISKALRARWRRSMPNNGLAHGRWVKNFESDEPGDSALPPAPATGGLKKPKSESQRQRINRHNNAIGIQVFHHDY